MDAVGDLGKRDMAAVILRDEVVDLRDQPVRLVLPVGEDGAHLHGHVLRQTAEFPHAFEFIDPILDRRIDEDLRILRIDLAQDPQTPHQHQHADAAHRAHAPLFTRREQRLQLRVDLPGAPTLQTREKPVELLMIADLLVPPRVLVRREKQVERLLAERPAQNAAAPVIGRAQRVDRGKRLADAYAGAHLQKTAGKAEQRAARLLELRALRQRAQQQKRKFIRADGEHHSVPLRKAGFRQPAQLAGQILHHDQLERAAAAFQLRISRKIGARLLLDGERVVQKRAQHLLLYAPALLRRLHAEALLDAADGLRKLFEHVRLYDIIGHGIPNRRLRVGEIGISSQKNDGDRELRPGQAVRELHAVHAGHPDIRDQQIRPVLPDVIEHVLPAARHVDDLAVQALPVDQRAERRPDGFFIVRQHDLPHFVHPSSTGSRSNTRVPRFSALSIVSPYPSP